MNNPTEIHSTMFGQFDVLAPDKTKHPRDRLIHITPVDIDAPLQTVWNIISDFEHYSSWNPFNRTMTTPKPVEVGNAIVLGIWWGPFDALHTKKGTQEAAVNLNNPEVITVFTPSQCLAYGDDKGLIHRAERVQYLEPLANGRVRYHTYERMRGLISPMIVKVYRARIIVGFTAAAQALKRHAEATHAANVSK